MTPAKAATAEGSRDAPFTDKAAQQRAEEEAAKEARLKAIWYPPHRTLWVVSVMKESGKYTPLMICESREDGQRLHAQWQEEMRLKHGISTMWANGFRVPGAAVITPTLAFEKVEP